MKSKPQCVLLIDDDDPTNYLNQWVLRHYGYSGYIKVSESGLDALNYLERSVDPASIFPVPDLIFLDINMPAMNGWEFLERFKVFKKKMSLDTVIVMLTTTLFTEDMIRADQIPEVSGFESKPLTPEILHKILAKYF